MAGVLTNLVLKVYSTLAYCSFKNYRNKVKLFFIMSNYEEKGVLTIINFDKTKVESVQHGELPTEPRVLRKVCVVVGVLTYFRDQLKPEPR